MNQTLIINRKEKLILIWLSVFILVAVFAIIISMFVYAAYVPLKQNAAQVEFEIKKGDGFREIAKRLKDNGLIRSSLVFKLFSVFAGYADGFKPGLYQISSSYSTAKIAKFFYTATGLDIKITITEGMDIFDIDKLLSDKNIVNSGEIIDFKPTSEFLKKYQFSESLDSGDFLKNLEGFLYPDSYLFRKYTPINQVIDKLLTNFDNKIGSMVYEINDKGFNFYDILILASIVESEIPFVEDRYTVSDILWKRLENGIPLQVDISIIYAKRLRNDFDRTIYDKDLKIISNYNTYKRIGLPPSPISNPSADSVRAVLYPQKSNYLYYISDPKTRRTIFSETLEEHNKVKNEYL